MIRNLPATPPPPSSSSAATQAEHGASISSPGVMWRVPQKQLKVRTRVSRCKAPSSGTRRGFAGQKAHVPVTEATSPWLWVRGDEGPLLVKWVNSHSLDICARKREGGREEGKEWREGVGKEGGEIDSERGGQSGKEERRQEGEVRQSAEGGLLPGVECYLEHMLPGCMEVMMQCH
ncbi:hypothetical protein EYF80_002034 [Liparis tanakae]|uniref:Uncharacterized protein n=1 Tax=Liparis tanakae TaxID=230148 RepID=A0A4Z2JCG6_9TELE|nr:hypothetical protein EYF80_002034 [Liparis tanakae]